MTSYGKPPVFKTLPGADVAPIWRKPIYTGAPQEWIVSTDPNTGFGTTNTGRQVSPSEVRNMPYRPTENGKPDGKPTGADYGPEDPKTGRRPQTGNAGSGTTPNVPVVPKAVHGTFAKPNPKRTPQSAGDDSPGRDTGADTVPDTGTDFTDIDQLMKLFQGVDPKTANALGDANTRMEYDGTMGALGRQIGDARADAQTRQNTIKDWFGKVLDQNSAGTQSDDAFAEKMINGSADVLKNIKGSMSDAAAADAIGKTGLSNDTFLRSLATNEHGYDTSMQTALALTGRDQATSYDRQDQKGINNLLGQLIDMTKERGQASVVNRQNAMTQLLGNRAANINQYATLAMLPGQLQGQQIDQFYKTMLATKAGTPTTPTSTYKASPSDIGGAAQSAVANLAPYLKDGKLPGDGKAKVMDIVRAVNQGYQAAGLTSTMPGVRASRDAILRKYGLDPQPGWNF